jgi:hypothetical protein
MVGGDLWEKVSSIKYTIVLKKDLWKEIGGIKTNSERTLKYKRLFIKTAALIKQYLKWENAAKKDNMEVLIKEVREAVRRQ